jgi:signal transduction histidine kinase
MRKSVLYRAALLAAIVVVLLNTWLASHALHTLIDTQFWLAHTLEVIDGTEKVVANTRTAESAARGYILTGAPSFLDQYNSSTHAIEGTIDHVQQLTADNPAQQQRIAGLRTRVAVKMAVLDSGVAVRQGHPTGMLDPSMMQAVIDDTPDRTESVHQMIASIEDQEQLMLQQRSAAAVSARRQVWVTLTIAFILDFLLLIAGFELLVRASRDQENIAEKAIEIDALNGELTLVNADLELRVELRTRELAISNQELEAFSYSVSHDLRAPLRTIDGFSLALQEDFSDKLNDEGRDYILRVRNGVQRMGSLIDALLQLSRVTRSDLQTERTDLSSLATLVFNDLQAGDPERDVLFLAQPGVLVQGDSRLLRIALENLIGNAWKFTSKTPSARIEFGSAQRDGKTVYFIRDNGAGFDMQYVDRLFTAFQRLHGDRDFKGSGIGLATVSRIIRRHHGEIHAESEPNKGANFYFNLAS